MIAETETVTAVAQGLRTIPLERLDRRPTPTPPVATTEPENEKTDTLDETREEMTEVGKEIEEIET